LTYQLIGDVRVLEHLLDPVERASPLFDHVGPVARQLAQCPDRRLGDEPAANQAVLHQIEEPLAVPHVGLPAWYRLDVGGVRQHHLDVGLEQVEHGAPVHARGLHRHVRDLVLDQPGRQLLDVRGHRAKRPGLPLPLPLLVDPPDGHDGGPLVHVDASTPGIHQVHGHASCHRSIQPPEAGRPRTVNFSRRALMAQTRILIQAPRALFFHGLTAPKVPSLAPLPVDPAYPYPSSSARVGRGP
jgi:hypothetical protein